MCWAVEPERDSLKGAESSLFLVQHMIPNLKETEEKLYTMNIQNAMRRPGLPRTKMEMKMNGGCSTSGFVVSSGWTAGVGRGTGKKELDVGRMSDLCGQT